MAERLDIILLGATGFTGSLCIPYLYKLLKEKNSELTWGVAGRSKQKLKETLKKSEKELGVDLSSVPIVVTDVKDYNSLLNMAKQARLVLSCCGPYKYLGNDIIKACIEAGTHQVDVNAELHFILQSQLEHGQQAKNKGVYIISACAFHSIPMDLGTIFTQNKFEGTLNSIEATLKLQRKGESLPGSYVNFTTYESVVNRLNWEEILDLREINKTWKKIKNLPKFEPEAKLNFLPHKPKSNNLWQIPDPRVDMHVANLTQTYLYESEKIRPTQVKSYIGIDSIFAVALLYFLGLVTFLLTQFQFGKNLLRKYPKIFTLGAVDHQAPSDEKRKNLQFELTLYGEGWKEKLSEPTDKFSTPPNKRIMAKLTDSNSVYGITCIGAVLASIIVLTETENLPGNGKGGVYPPGFAFAKTSMVEQLDRNGLKFEVVYQKDL